MKDKILLVDDDADSLTLLSFIVERFPCTVVSESSGEAALEQIRQTNFALVMLDIQLPDVSGLDIVRQVRQSPRHTSLPIVAVTALARQQDEAAILGAGCDRYISKPYLIEDVEALISHYILKRRR